MKPVENPESIEMEYGRKSEHLYDYLIDRYVNKVDIDRKSVCRERVSSPV